MKRLGIFEKIIQIELKEIKIYYSEKLDGQVKQQSRQHLRREFVNYNT